MLLIITSRPIVVVLVCLVVLIAVVYFLLPGAYTPPITTVALSPAPTKTDRCWIYDKMFPATAATFKNHNISTTEQREIEKWKATVPLSKRMFVRWMRDPFDLKYVYVFVAYPLHQDINTPWQALNNNVLINTTECDLAAFPKA